MSMSNLIQMLSAICFYSTVAKTIIFQIELIFILSAFSNKCQLICLLFLPTHSGTCKSKWNLKHSITNLHGCCGSRYSWLCHASTLGELLDVLNSLLSIIGYLISFYLFRPGTRLYSWLDINTVHCNSDVKVLALSDMPISSNHRYVSYHIWLNRSYGLQWMTSHCISCVWK